MADLVMSGEVALSPTIFQYHSLEAKAKGAPIDWAPILRATWVCGLYGVPALVAAGLVFLRRDVAGD